MSSFRATTQSTTVGRLSVQVHVVMATRYRWDTAGAERFKGVTTSYFRGANGKVTVIIIQVVYFICICSCCTCFRSVATR